MSVTYYDELRVQFNEGFSHFCAQVLELFKDSSLDFSQVQINLEESVTMTPGGGELVSNGVVDLDNDQTVADDPAS